MAGGVNTHWLSFDPAQIAKVRAVLGRGTGFEVHRAYNHPSDMSRVVLQVRSRATYASLDLDVNSLTSPLRRHARQPSGLGQGMAIEAFERIYGPLK